VGIVSAAWEKVNEFFNVNVGGSCSNHCAFKIWRIMQFVHTVHLWSFLRLSGIMVEDFLIKISHLSFFWRHAVFTVG
jgi:hypothetical protein